MTSYYSEDIDEPEPLGKQALPIAHLPDDFDGEPLDGMQYLFTVRRDARALPSTTRVHNPYELPEAVLPPPPPTTDKSNLLPSQEWLQVFESRFRNLRKNLKQATIHVGTPIGTEVQIPPSMDRILWWAFLEGEPRDVWCPAKQSKRHQKRIARQTGQTTDRSESEPPKKRARFEVEYSDVRDQPSGHPPGTPTPRVAPKETEEGEIEETELSKETGGGEGEVLKEIVVINEEGERVATSTYPSKSALTPREVTPSLLSRLDAKQPLQLIRSFTYWLSHQPPTYSKPQENGPAEQRYFRATTSHARWIFGLLATVEAQLTGDETHMLRELTRAILNFISERLRGKYQGRSPVQQELSQEDELAPWWANVAIVVTFWGQKDLWLDAEDVVRRIQG